MPAGSSRTDLLPNHLVVGDSFLTTASGGEYDHINPATGKIQRTLPMAGADEVDRAIAAARAALPQWRSWSPIERRRALMRLADLMRRDLADLTVIASLETGYPITQTPFAVQWGIDWLEEAAGWADRIYGDTRQSSRDGTFEYSMPEPYGVVAVLATWNGSVGAFGMSAGAPLAAGCAIVIKPSELAPFGIIRVAELALEAGIPAGVVNVIPGGVEAAQALVAHPGIDKITFTGSPPTGRLIAASCAAALTPCVLELGGKSANLIFSDADLDKAIEGAMGVVLNSGQVCTLGSRVLVQSDIYDHFNERLALAANSIKQGDPFTEGVVMGPVINEAACDRITALIGRARAYGEIIAGGDRVGGELADGYFIAPTIVAGVTNGSELARTEVFGPVLAVIPFDTEDDAVAIANDSEYGLAAYIYTKNLSRAHRVASGLDAGNIGINGGFAPANPAMPFGGRKQSGYGRQGGLAGVMEFVNTKTVQVRL